MNKMVLFLGAPKQGLTDKIDIFWQIYKFLLVFASRAWDFNFTLLLSDMNFTHLLVLRDEANHAVCQSIGMPEAMQNLFHVNFIFFFFEFLAIAWKHFTHIHSVV